MPPLPFLLVSPRDFFGSSAHRHKDQDMFSVAPHFFGNGVGTKITHRFLRVGARFSPYSLRIRQILVSFARVLVT